VLFFAPFPAPFIALYFLESPRYNGNLCTWIMKANQNDKDMSTIAEIARDFPQVSITIQAADLLAFGERLVADTMAAARADEAARIKAAEAEDLITDAEACRLFGVSKQTLWRWRAKGYIEGVAVGGRIKYRRADCRRILDQKGV